MSGRTATYLLIFGLLIVMAGPVRAQDEWQLEIQVRVQNAGNRLIIGQTLGASDAVDGRYDVPALLNGDVQAYMTLSGQQLWKDMRTICTGSCRKQWNIIVESPLTDELVSIGWDPEQIPSGISMVLLNMETGGQVDMNRESGMAFANKGMSELVIIGNVQ